jgi:AraC-like DNA-binding protein
MQNHQSGIRRELIATQHGEHVHDFAQILIGWQGKMTCELPLETGALSRGRFALAPDQLPHLFSGDSQDCELLVVDLSADDPTVRYIQDSTGVSVADLFRQQHLFSMLPLTSLPCLEFAAGQLANASPFMQQRINAQMLPMVVLQVADAMLEQDRLWQSVQHQRFNSSEFRRLIDQAPERQWSNEWLAHHFNMSESHFYTVCQAQLGLSPQKYILQRKLQQAQTLLRQSSLPVSVLAHQFGFSSTSAFSRAYRKMMGHSPAQARGRQH